MGKGLFILKNYHNTKLFLTLSCFVKDLNLDFGLNTHIFSVQIINNIGMIWLCIFLEFRIYCDHSRTLIPSEACKSIVILI